MHDALSLETLAGCIKCCRLAKLQGLAASAARSYWVALLV